MPISWEDAIVNVKAVSRARDRSTVPRMAASLFNGLGRRESYLTWLKGFKAWRNILDENKDNIKNKVRLQILKLFLYP